MTDASIFLLCIFALLPVTAITGFILSQIFQANARRQQRELEAQRHTHRMAELGKIPDIISVYLGVTGVKMDSKAADDLADHLSRAFGLVGKHPNGLQEAVEAVESYAKRIETAVEERAQLANPEEYFRLRRMEEVRRMVERCKAQGVFVQPEDITQWYEAAEHPTEGVDTASASAPSTTGVRVENGVGVTTADHEEDPVRKIGERPTGATARR